MFSKIEHISLSLSVLSTILPLISINSNKEGQIRKGKFSFDDFITYPYAFRLGLKINSHWRYISDMFFIQSGLQILSCNIDSNREIPFLSNHSMKELRGEFINSLSFLQTNFNKIDTEYDSLFNIYKGKIPKNILLDIENKRSTLIDSRKVALLEYTKKHPNSYVALWELIKEFSSGYEPVYDSIYSYFSDSIKNTFTGKVLLKKLSSSKVLALHDLFPKLFLLNTSNNKVTVPNLNSGDKYILIDFWFSHCGPCLREFKQYTKIYKLYKKIGFEIIGISIDNIGKTNYWRKIIKEKGLVWLQYLDQGGKISRTLSINSFPTNFLLNEKGEIIQKNIASEELENLLKAYSHQYKTYDKSRINETD